MAATNTEEVKKRILNILQSKGPSIPINIAKDLKISSLFASAFLSELKQENKIKLSNLKIGGTPLYLIQGQESQLENFQQYLHPKEQEALKLLKSNKVLKDLEQDPAIRVALRSIKDFAFAFKKDEELFWRFLTITEQEVKEILEPINVKKEEIKIEETKEEIKTVERKQEKKEADISVSNSKEPEPVIPKIKKIKQEEQKEIDFNNPLAIKPEPKKEKIKPKSEFVIDIIKFLEKNNFKILEEKEHSKKEYNCISQLNTDLGPIDFLTQAKDKKTVSEEDLDKLLRQAQTIPLPALVVYTGILNKKAIEYQEKYRSILKTKKFS